MLKEDWEFFKAQRKILEEQVAKSTASPVTHRYYCIICFLWNNQNKTLNTMKQNQAKNDIRKSFNYTWNFSSSDSILCIIFYLKILYCCKNWYQIILFDFLVFICTYASLKDNWFLFEFIQFSTRAFWTKMEE